MVVELVVSLADSWAVSKVVQMAAMTVGARVVTLVVSKVASLATLRVVHWEMLLDKALGLEMDPDFEQTHVFPIRSALLILSNKKKFQML